MSFIKADIINAIESVKNEVASILEKVVEAQRVADCDKVIDYLYVIEDELVELLKSLR